MTATTKSTATPANVRPDLLGLYRPIGIGSVLAAALMLRAAAQ